MTKLIYYKITGPHREIKPNQISLFAQNVVQEMTAEQ